MGIELLARDTTGLTVLMLDNSPQPCWCRVRFPWDGGKSKTANCCPILRWSTNNLFLRSIQMKMTKAAKKVGKLMGEYKAGTLHSGKGGKVVKNPKQAIAIAMSEAKLPMRGSRTAKNMKSKGMK